MHVALQKLRSNDVSALDVVVIAVAVDVVVVVVACCAKQQLASFLKA